MLESNEKALLPEGLHDTLVGDAVHEMKIVEKLLSCFDINGYDLIVPPMVEFEESLLIGPGKAQSRNMFRLMDPASQRMMGVRTDITGQVARISHSRLGKMPRPLRLSYAGDVLRVKGTQLRPERQFKQVGVELIGSDTTDAYIEIIILAHEALTQAGVKNLSVDLTVPLLVPALCMGLGVDAILSDRIRRALDSKDIGELANLDGEIGEISRELLKAAGPVKKGLYILSRLTLPPEAAEMCLGITNLVKCLNEVAPDLKITLDPGEFTGFEYQSGISFSLFASGVRGELGRGGRYMVNAELAGGGEPATGFSLYLDSMMRALSASDILPKIYIPFGTKRAEIIQLQLEKYRTIQGLEKVKDISSEARRLKCQHYWFNGQVINSK
jgi:ATP phosphoribosyltransferase regulatory subunit